MNMMEDHEVSQAGRRLRARNTGRKKRVAKERVKQGVLSWTEQNEIRGVLDRMTADAAWKILDSAYSREIKAQQKTVFIAAKTKEDTVSVTRE